MSNNRKIGWAALSPEQLRAVSRKGGSAKVPKGWAKLSPEERRANGLRAYQIRLKKKEERENANITTEN